MSGLLARLSLAPPDGCSHPFAPEAIEAERLERAASMRGKTCVGTLARGIRNGQERSFYIYNVTDHEKVYAELGVQATAYQTGVPPVIAAELMANGRWSGVGVMSPEQFDPDPFMTRLGAMGMPWHIRDEDTGKIDAVEMDFAEPVAA